MISHDVADYRWGKRESLEISRNVADYCWEKCAGRKYAAEEPRVDREIVLE